MQRFRKILCVMEHGEESRPALERAVELAENNQADLTVADVIPELPTGIGMPDGAPSSHDLQAAMEREHKARIVSLFQPYRERLDITHRVLVGIGFLEVIREVLRNGHDLVIKCPESPAWLDRLFAGDDMHLLRKCPCPVWFIKPHAPRPYKRILAAVDVDEFYPPHELKIRHRLNMKILETASSLAISEFAELHVAHAWESMTELADGLAFSSSTSPDRRAANIGQEHRLQRQLLEKLIRDLKSTHNAAHDALQYLNPVMHLVKGPARKEIPSLAKRLTVDCIVMGTVARTGIRGFFMGNTAETILEQIDCSVLAIKPDGFVTPVTIDVNRPGYSGDTLL